MTEQVAQLIQPPVPPHNFEAEQALLGAILMSNRALGKVVAFLLPQHFADPVHGRIYEACLVLTKREQIASPVTLKTYLAQDAGLKDMGGDAYLMNLAGAAASIINAEDYGRLIFDLALRRELIGVGEDIVNGAFDSGIEVDAAQQISDAIAGLDKLGRLIGLDGLRSADDFKSDVIELYKGTRNRPLSTGFYCLDQLYRVRTGELTVVTGIPSSGKSEWVDAVAVNLAMREKWKFAVCSFENPPGDHIGKLCEKYIGKPFNDGPTPRMSEAELERAMAWVNEHFHFIRAEKDSPTIEWSIARAKSAVDRYGIKGLILDPYNEFEHRRATGVTETEYISQSLGSLKRFLANNGVHGWFIAHPAKPAQDRRDEIPSLYDISGSSNWANKADAGIVVHRPFNSATGERSKEAEIHVKKIRFKFCGKPGLAKLTFNPSTGRYEESAPRPMSRFRDDD